MVAFYSISIGVLSVLSLFQVLLAYRTSNAFYGINLISAMFTMSIAIYHTYKLMQMILLP